MKSIFNLLRYIDKNKHDLVIDKNNHYQVDIERLTIAASKNREFKEMYCVVNLKREDSYLNYASKTKKFFNRGFSYYLASSPFPTLRPMEHFPTFHEWIQNTPNPEDYKVIKWVYENEV